MGAARFLEELAFLSIESINRSASSSRTVSSLKRNLRSAVCNQAIRPSSVGVSQGHGSQDNNKNQLEKWVAEGFL
jgi:hypothetical protein